MNTLKKARIPFLMVLLLNIFNCIQGTDCLNKKATISEDSIEFIQIKTDTLFNSNQIISLLTLQKESFNKYVIIFSHSDLDFKTTSSFGENNNAVAAINGGFFNMDSGGSATYFEINDSTIAKTRNPDLKWGIRRDLMNGAIVISTDSTITIQQANSDQFYELSKQEIAVMVTGPLLLLDSETMNFPDLKFVNNRHPRTCMCMNEESVIFITIDGRKRNAQGMSLIELQEYLKDLGCTDAINLDGGGSTTMWIKEKGVVNYPSDKSGERPVSNAILIINK